MRFGATVFVLATAAISANEARAASCVYNGADRALTISVAGETAVIAVRTNDGAILLNTAHACAAYVNTVDSILVLGGAGVENVTLSYGMRNFEPGFSAEVGGVAEIEFVVDLGLGRDTLTVQGPMNSANRIFVGLAGADTNGDGDADVAIAGTELLIVRGGYGDDIISAADAILPTALYGNAGNDLLAGGSGNDRLYGGPGHDQLFGNGGDDAMDGNAGDDVEDGGPGRDTFDQNAAINGNDMLRGGDGVDIVSYGLRTAGLHILMDNWANDGDAMNGEADDVGTDVENVISGSGDDWIVGSDGPNVLEGGAGHDFIMSAGGDDRVIGGAGGDFIMGGDGNDTLEGGAGDDTLLGELGNDNLFDGTGNDWVEGGDGNDNLSCTGGGVDVCYQ